jgi:hypothetical protein
VQDDEAVLDAANTNSVLDTVASTLSNEFEYTCHDEAIRLRNVSPIDQSTDDRVPGHKYSIPSLPGTSFLVHLV